MTAITSIEISDVLHKTDRHEEVLTPTTPRPGNAAKSLAPSAIPLPPDEPSQIPSSDSQPNPPSQPPSDTATQNSTLEPGQSDKPSLGANEDKWDAMDVDGSDPDQDGSDNDTENGDPDGSTRKKKGQRFFCTGYPPCNLSFTRSEHLARHIRKHTGERPFQCHCNRRFSRLDNLRQHAQTVHVNEEIPTDSLAATGTRFQRQIRTDRVRPAGRPRTNTIGSTGSHGRGHSRNLSNSSVGSTSSNFSTTAETRRRPPPLLMANDSSGRPKLGIEPPITPPAQYRGYGNQSPGDLSTPTSTNYSATPGSPMYGSSMGSPMSTTSRVSGYFGGRTPGRRLSVPSAANPFQPNYSNAYPASYMNQMPPSSNASANSSVFASPTSSTFAQGPSYSLPPSEDWRRRTWHPSSYSSVNFNYGRPATSGLTYSQTPDAPQPAFAQNATAAAGQAPRLPGIESFDHMQHRPSTPPRRQPSPMQLDSLTQSPNYGMHPAHGQTNRSPLPGSRPGHVSWDVSRSSTYPASDEHMHLVSEQASWGQQTISELQSVGVRHEGQHRPSNMGPPPPNSQLQHPQQMAQEALQLQPVTPKSNKRHGWYIVPPAATRTSPEDSSSSEGISTPRTSAVEIHPVIVHSNGYIDPHHQAMAADGHSSSCLPAPNRAHGYPGRMENPHQPAPYDAPRNRTNEMTGLEALVAVATSEEKASATVR